MCPGNYDSKEQSTKDVTILTVAIIIIFLVFGGCIVALVAYMLVRRRQTRKGITVNANPIYAVSHPINHSNDDQTLTKARV